MSDIINYLIFYKIIYATNYVTVVSSNRNSLQVNVSAKIINL